MHLLKRELSVTDTCKSVFITEANVAEFKSDGDYLPLGEYQFVGNDFFP